MSEGTGIQLQNGTVQAPAVGKLAGEDRKAITQKTKIWSDGLHERGYLALEPSSKNAKVSKPSPTLWPRRYPASRLSRTERDAIPQIYRFWKLS
jgi:hypothetical protein